MATRSDLSELCRKANLAVSGTKQDMLDRLLGDDAVRAAIMGAASTSSGTCTSGKCDVSKSKGIKKKPAGPKALKSQSRHSGAEFAKFFNEKQGALVRAGVHGADEVRTLIENMWDNDRSGAAVRVRGARRLDAYAVERGGRGRPSESAGRLVDGGEVHDRQQLLHRADRSDRWHGCLADQRVDQHGVNMERKIRKSATKAPDDTVWRKHQLLFGSRAPIKLTSAMLSHLSNEYDYRIDDSLGSAYPEPCPQLAELAELFSSFGTGFKYVDAKGKLSQCETELLVKPAAISAWLAAARGRGYTAMRVCMHGSDLVGYDAIKRDPIGFSLVSQGRHAMAHGPGVYLGLSDHVTIQYNGYSGLKAGTALLCLLLTDEDMVKENGLYKTFTLNAPRDLVDQSLETCIVVRELYLVLILGFVKAI